MCESIYSYYINNKNIKFTRIYYIIIIKIKIIQIQNIFIF